MASTQTAKAGKASDTATLPTATLPLYIKIPMIQASSLVAEACTFPIDFTKTRMQVAQSKTNFVQVLRSAVKAEGLGSVYKGIEPAVIRHWIYTATRIALYEDLRNAIAGSDRGHDAPLWAKGMAGMCAGGVGQLLASPADLVKIRLQTGTPGRYSGFSGAVRTIMREEGWRGFYKGWRPNVARAAIVNIGELATYDEAKHLVRTTTGLQDGVYLHTLSALCSGFVAALLSTPADVCKSRVMSGVYPTMMSCLVGTVRNEGVLALWKGFGPNWYC